MHTRILPIGAVLALVFAGFMLARQSPAQAPASKGIFSKLKVGQMVYVNTQGGTSIVVYEDRSLRDQMTGKITEIGNDYIVVEIPQGEQVFETRLPVYSLTSVLHVEGRASGKKAPGKKRDND